MNKCLTMLAFFALTAPTVAQNLADIEKRVTEFTLDNGLHFIVYERHQSPVVSFYTHVDAGSANDPKGATGIAHMFEHMAFKGTPTIGATNYEAEKKALERVEQIYNQLEQEKRRRLKADPDKLKQLENQLKDAVQTANSFVVQNAFPRIIEESGGVGLNASTAEDHTNYFYSLPGNKIELWFLLESARFKQPVYREFYKERDVVREERRMRTESSPQGTLVEAMATTAFAAHPYGVPGVGWASDIENLRVEDAERFFKEYYVPNNLTIAIAGDVDPAEAKRLAQKYFGDIPGAPRPPLIHTEEPPQPGEKRVEVESPAQPFLLVGYKRPDQYHPDSDALDILDGVLSGGRTSMMYEALVRDSQMALAAQTIGAFPGSKFPGLFLIFLVPNQGKTVEQVEKAAYEVIEKAKKGEIEQELIDRVKTNIRAGLIRQLASNSGMASNLATYHANFGDWRELFRSLEKLEKVTLDDVKRVANLYLTEDRRTVAYTVQPAPAEPQAAQAAKPAGGAQ